MVAALPTAPLLNADAWQAVPWCNERPYPQRGWCILESGVSGEMQARPY
jgi:hypothetical protein